MEEQLSQEQKFLSAAETQTPEAENIRPPQSENLQSAGEDSVQQLQSESPDTEKKPNENLKRKLLLADAIALACVQFTSLILLLTGIVPLFGASFPVWRIISVIADIIESVSFFAWYKIFAPGFIAIAYIAALCFLVTKTIKTAKSLKLYVSSRKGADLLNISRCAFLSVVIIFALIAFSNSFYKNAVNAAETVILVLTGAAYLYHRAAICYVNFKKPDFVYLMFSTAYYAGIYLLVAVVFCSFNECVFRETANLFNAMSNNGGMGSARIFFESFIMPALYMITLFFLMKVCAGCLNNDLSGKIALRGWISTIVLLVSAALCVCLIPTKFKEFSFVSLWLSIRSVIFPLFVLMTMLWAMITFFKKPRQPV